MAKQEKPFNKYRVTFDLSTNFDPDYLIRLKNMIEEGVEDRIANGIPDQVAYVSGMKITKE